MLEYESAGSSPETVEVPLKGQESREGYSIKIGPLDVSRPKAGKYVGFSSYLSVLYLEAIPQWVILPHLTPLRLLSLASSPQSDLGCHLFH
ncbi:hypothetical protein VN97_g8014 [Penicillium thymicola]|uniref:Uncharacterized protein n=1 Tax=Penicillium thymicola TaxID=293382 RepID=A0AAI9TEI5_PENTH|nr:hypothetical protein VN97_g8014 [Penicillium thymicola]